MNDNYNKEKKREKGTYLHLYRYDPLLLSLDNSLFILLLRRVPDAAPHPPPHPLFR